MTQTLAPVRAIREAVTPPPEPACAKPRNDGGGGGGGGGGGAAPIGIPQEPQNCAPAATVALHFGQDNCPDIDTTGAPFEPKARRSATARRRTMSKPARKGSGKAMRDASLSPTAIGAMGIFPSPFASDHTKQTLW